VSPADVIRRLLELRGIDAAEFERFLSPSLADLAAPEDLPGVVEAADVILAAVAARRRIVVFGDYDCDGVCATAILVKAIGALAPGQVEPFLPERLTEGYGMSDASVARMLKEHPGVGLVVTVDNGINSVSQIALLRAHGIRVVVTDHHLPGETLPDANALVNPKVSAPAPLTNLCGAGVAFLLANRLINAARAEGVYEGPNVGGPLLILAGLATVTDVMPLVGQNRILVSEALRRFRSLAPLGLLELHARAARSGTAALTSKDFGFMLGPRINAAGRLASGMDALDLILETNRERVREYALRIDLNNTERKAIEQRMTDQALEQLVSGAPAQVIDLPDGHPGVAGIVAARVMERLAQDESVPPVPVCVYVGGHGSARAPEGLNIRDAFVACDEVLSRYGGHAAAGGFSVKEGRVDDFRRLLCDYCAQQLAAGNVPKRPAGSEAEIELEPGDITLELAEELRRLEPFGEGNPEPVFGLTGVRLAEVKPMGADGRHLAVTFAVGGAPRLRAVWWNRGDLVEKLRAASMSAYDTAFTLAVSDYGERHVELRLTRLQPMA